MKIKMGSFFPRLEYGWPPEKPRRCHKLGGHAVELQGGLAIADLGAQHGDGRAVTEAFRRVEDAADELAKGLPEHKGMVDVVGNRARMLRKLVEPYQYSPMPKKTAKVVQDQIRELGAYELKIEGNSIRACGGHPTGAHSFTKEEPLKPLSQIPPELKKQSAKKDAENKRDLARRAARYQAKAQREIRALIKKAKKR